MKTQWRVADLSPVAYGGEEAEFPYERELVKAQFVRELTEHLGYPQTALHLNVSVLVKDLGFQVADVAAENDRGEIAIVAGVETPKEYEKNQEKHVRDLYLQAAVFARTRRVKHLVYYTRWYEEAGLLCKKYSVIDYAKYAHYYLWQKAGFLSDGTLPEYKSN